MFKPDGCLQPKWTNSDCIQMSITVKTNQHKTIYAF